MLAPPKRIEPVAASFRSKSPRAVKLPSGTTMGPRLVLRKSVGKLAARLRVSKKFLGAKPVLLRWIGRSVARCFVHRGFAAHLLASSGGALDPPSSIRGSFCGRL